MLSLTRNSTRYYRSGVLRLIQELATLSSSTPWSSTVRHYIQPSPFGTTAALRPQPERLPPPTVTFYGTTRLPNNSFRFVINAVVAMNTQVRDYFWQHSSGGSLALAVNLWIVFGATTLLNLSPFKGGRRCNYSNSHSPHRVFSIFRYGSPKSGETHKDL